MNTVFEISRKAQRLIIAIQSVFNYMDPEYELVSGETSYLGFLCSKQKQQQQRRRKQTWQGLVNFILVVRHVDVVVAILSEQLVEARAKNFAFIYDVPDTT
jgi:hypothetical protein